MTVTLKYEIEDKPYSMVECLKICPYKTEDCWGLKPMIGSITCEVCQYNKGIDKENKTVECSYEYEHLTEEEQRSVHENI